MTTTESTTTAAPAHVVDLILRALESTGRIVDAVGDHQWHETTLCDPWDVHVETNHLVGGMRIFAATLAREEPDAEHESDWLGHDPRSAYRRAAEADAAAWQSPEVLEGTVRLGFGIVPRPLAAAVHLTEVVIHGVDIALAIQRPDLVEEDLCAVLLAAMHGMGGLDPFRVPGMFGPQTPVPADAAPHQELLAYAGRHIQP